MEEDKTVVPEDLETQEGAEALETTPTEESPEETIAKLKTEKEEIEKKNKELYARVKKGEKKEKEEPSNTLSDKDLFALMKANVAEEDIDEIRDFAAFKKLTIGEALKNPTLKTILSDKAEERKSAQVAMTKGAKPTSKTSGEDLIVKASRGELPEKDDDIQKLAEARMAAKLKK